MLILSSTSDCVSLDLCASVCETLYQKHCEGNNPVIMDYILSHQNVLPPFHERFRLMPRFHDNEKATITFLLSTIEGCHIIDTEGNLIG